ncbi:MAG TPA: hypothetical protein PKX92_10110 [Edaphocola sp.]|nr:hypothetical protein [Edaphocola sp.]
MKKNCFNRKKGEDPILKSLNLVNNLRGKALENAPLIFKNKFLKKEEAKEHKVLLVQVEFRLGIGKATAKYQGENTPIEESGTTPLGNYVPGSSLQLVFIMEKSVVARVTLNVDSDPVTPLEIPAGTHQKTFDLL